MCQADFHCLAPFENEAAFGDVLSLPDKIENPTSVSLCVSISYGKWHGFGGKAISGGPARAIKKHLRPSRFRKATLAALATGRDTPVDCAWLSRNGRRQ